MARPKYEKDIDKLCVAMQSARKVQQYARKQHMEAVRLYAGDQWNSETALEKTYVNFLALAADVMLRSVSATNPRVMLSTMDMKSKPVASAMESWANDDFSRMGFGSILRKISLNGLFSGGFSMVSLATPMDAALGGWGMKAGEPCIQNIDMDDMGWDPRAKDWDECDFIFHRYRAPMAAAKEFVTKSARDTLVVSTDARFNTEGDERINTLGRGYWGNDEEYEDKVDLYNVYCPRKRMVYTLSEDCLTGACAPAHGGVPIALKEQEWIGDDRGPYPMLAFGTVPGNVAPHGPLMNLINMHRGLNRIISKLLWSAINLKDILIAPKGADGDIERVRTSMHGDILGLDRPKEFANVSMNVPNNMLIQLFVMLKELFSWMAGNLNIVGGLSSESKTLGQDKISNENASRMMAEMQDRTIEFTSDVARRYLWYGWHNPKLVMKSEYTLPGHPDIRKTRELHPWNGPGPLNRSMNWEDLHIRIDAYSMTRATPQTMAADLIGFIKEVWTPLAQLFASQGKVLNLEAFMDKLGKYKNMPDLKEITASQEPPPQMMGGEGPPSAGPRPAPDETTHIRENVSTRSEKGNTLNLISAMSGVDPGGAQRNGQMNGQPM